MMPSNQHLLRYSLVLVWLGTAVASAVEYHGASRTLLEQAGLQSTAWMNIWIGGGIGVDLLMGLALWIWPSRRTYAAALVLMLVMTAMATAMLPTLWLDPLGPLLKNLPIAALLVVLYRSGASS